MPRRDLLEAIKKGDVASVKSILGTDSTALTSGEEATSPVLTALYHGQSEMAEMLALRGELDIFEAAATGRVDRLAELLAADPSANGQSTDGWTPLHLAAFFGRTEAARMLMDGGADLKAVSANSTSNTPLHAALAGRGDEELVLRMLMAGADAKAAGAEGYTPLHVAATRGNQRVCDLLIQSGPQPGTKMRDGKTAADLATERGHDGLGEYLRRME